MEVTYYLHTLHSWNFDELSQIKERIDQIAQNNTSAIKYDHKRLVFTIAGSDRERQKQALAALSDLVKSKAPAEIRLPKRFRNGQTGAPGSTPHSTTGSSSGSLIDVQDIATSFNLIDMNPPPPQTTKYSIEFHVDDNIQDPNEFFYSDKRQKTDLPTMLANNKGCEALVSADGRTVTISGESMPKITAIQNQLQRIQTHYLRPPFQPDYAALVYGSTRDEFRLMFVPIQEHQYFAKHIKFFPSSLPRLPQPINYCVIEKATYDYDQEDWVIRNDVKIHSRPTASQQRRPSVPISNNQPIRQPARSNWGQPPPPLSDRTGRFETGQEWFDQRSSTFSSNNSSTMTASSRQPSFASQYNSNSTVNRSYRPDTPKAPTWSSAGVANIRATSAPTNTSEQRKVRRLPQSEWEAPIFNSTGDNDFPSFSSGNRPSQKRTGVPSLPPPRSINATSMDYSRPPSVPPQASRPSSVLVFKDQDWDYLEDKASQSSGGQRSREMGSSGLDVPRLRDPESEFADSQRTIRRLPMQQATPGGSSSPFVGSDRFIDSMRVYNMRRLAESIRNGLTELQGRRMEIRLFGRLGNVVYPTHQPMLTRPWEFTDIENVLVKKRNILPIFSPITTTVPAHVDSLYGVLGKYKTESAYYEVECDTRTNPTSRYVRTLVIVPSTAAVLERVVTPWETFGEAMWNAVDKHADFEILLQAREGVIYDTNSALGRTDVKPFSNFRKKLSLGTHNSHITCRNVPDFLEVRAINFRVTRTYEKPGGFTVEIHKIEELELMRTGGIDSVTGRTGGRGKLWYEFEVTNDKTKKLLQTNLTLQPGTIADWDVNDIIGDDANTEELATMVKRLMILVDECQKTLHE
ncbi:hypothetical protein FBU30_009712 [Linnemannia zychae]|nr:hypothetical protein FBU30_009712 [Linnemannia zychae]